MRASAINRGTIVPLHMRVDLPNWIAPLKRYLMVGALTTIVSFTIIFLLMQFLAVNVYMANAIGYAAGVVIGFVLNRHWTFSSNDRWLPSFCRWLFILAIAYTANLATVWVFIDSLGLNRYASQFAGLPVYLVVGFAGSRMFAFPTDAPAIARTE
ncbi:MAG: GtrA family protein [Steroidobacteraceae bacterium]